MDPAESSNVETQVWPYARRVSRPGATRLWATLVFSGCVAVLGLSVWLRPDPRGYGTHQQLGAGPCGMLITTHLPCPTCGMTTAFAYTVRGQVWSAIRAQPAGFILALATVVVLGMSAWTIVRGRWPWRVLWTVYLHRLFLALLIVLIAGWAAKIAMMSRNSP